MRAKTPLVHAEVHTPEALALPKGAEGLGMPVYRLKHAL